MDREIVILLLRGIIPGAFVGFGFALELYRSESSRPADQPSPRQVATPILMALTLVGVFAFAFPLRVRSGLFDWLGWLPVLLALIGAGFVLSPWRIAGALVALFGVALAVLFAPRAEWSGAESKNAFLSVASVVGVGAIFHPAWRNRPLLLLTIATIAAAFPRASEAAPFSGGFDGFAALVSLVAFVALWKFKQDIMKVIALCALAGLIRVGLA